MDHLLGSLDQIENLEDQLRDRINRGVLHHQLLNDKYIKQKSWAFILFCL